MNAPAHVFRGRIAGWPPSSLPFPRRNRHRRHLWPTPAPNSSSPSTRPSSRRRRCSAPMRSASGRRTGIRNSSIPNPRTISQAWSFRWRMATIHTWVNTAFDLAAGHIQYAYVLNDAMARHRHPPDRESAQKTGVRVVYERTALMPEANEHVQHFAREIGRPGRNGKRQINGYFAKVRGISPK